MPTRHIYFVLHSHTRMSLSPAFTHSHLSNSSHSSHSLSLTLISLVWLSLTITHSLSLTLTLALSLTLPHSLSLILPHSLSLTLTRTLSLSPILPNSSHDCRYGRKLSCLIYCVLYIVSCMTKHSPDFNVLLFGRFTGTYVCMRA